MRTFPTQSPDNHGHFEAVEERARRDLGMAKKNEVLWLVWSKQTGCGTARWSKAHLVVCHGLEMHDYGAGFLARPNLLRDDAGIAAGCSAVSRGVLL